MLSASSPLRVCQPTHTHTHTHWTALADSPSSVESRIPASRRTVPPFCGQIDVLLVSCRMFSIPQRAGRSGLALASPLITWFGPYPPRHPLLPPPWVHPNTQQNRRLRNAVTMWPSAAKDTKKWTEWSVKKKRNKNQSNSLYWRAEVYHPVSPCWFEGQCGVVYASPRRVMHAFMWLGVIRGRDGARQVRRWGWRGRGKQGWDRRVIGWDEKWESLTFCYPERSLIAWEHIPEPLPHP